jgi:hypothetical protein
MANRLRTHYFDRSDWAFAELARHEQTEHQGMPSEKVAGAQARNSHLSFLSRQDRRTGERKGFRHARAFFEFTGLHLDAPLLTLARLGE